MEEYLRQRISEKQLIFSYHCTFGRRMSPSVRLETYHDFSDKPRRAGQEYLNFYGAGIFYDTP